MADENDIVVRLVGQDDGLTDKLNQSAASLDNLRASVKNVTSGTATAEAAAEAWGARLAATAAVTQTASAEVGAMSGALSHASGNISIATREFRALFDELSSGRTRMVPGTIAIIAQRVFGLSGAALLAGGGVLALAGGIGYLIYESVEADNNIRKLTEAFALSGRGAEFSSSAIKSEIDFLGKLPGSTSAAADGYMKLVAQHANISFYLSNQVGQLMPAFIDQLGSKAPEGAAKLAETLANLSISGFQKLDQETLNLAPAQYEMIENLIDTGQKGQAVEAILKALGTNSGIYIKSLGDQVFDTKNKIKDLEEEIKIEAATGNTDAQLAAIKALEVEQTKLNNLRGQEQVKGQQEANNEYKKEYDFAVGVNRELDKEATTTNTLIRLNRDLQAAKTRGDTTGAAAFTKAIAAEEVKAAQEEATANEKTYRLFVDQENAKGAAAKEGSGLRIKIAQEEVTRAAQLFGLESTQYAQAMQNLNTQRRAASDQEIQRQKEESRQIMADISTSSNEIRAIRVQDMQTDLQISQMQFQAKKDELENEVAQNKITNAQKIALLKDLVRAEAEANIAELTAEQSMDGVSLQEKENLYNKIRLARAKLNTDLAQLELQNTTNVNKEASKQASIWQKMDTTILQTETQFVRGIFSGRQTLSQSLLQLSSNELANELTLDLRYYTQKLLLNAEGLNSDKMTEAGGLAVHLLNLTAKSDADVAATAADMSRQAADAVAAKAIEIPKNTATIMGDAAVAGAGAYAATAAIPVVGPALAPAAGATAYAATAAYAALGVAEGGEWNTGSGGFYMLHPQESVMPANIANPMRDFFTGGGQGGSQGGDQYHITINAVDAGSVSRLFMNNGRALIGSLARAKRNLDPFFSQGPT